MLSSCAFLGRAAHRALPGQDRHPRVGPHARGGPGRQRRRRQLVVDQHRQGHIDTVRQRRVARPASAAPSLTATDPDSAVSPDTATQPASTASIPTSRSARRSGRPAQDLAPRPPGPRPGCRPRAAVRDPPGHQRSIARPGEATASPGRPAAPAPPRPRTSPPQQRRRADGRAGSARRRGQARTHPTQSEPAGRRPEGGSGRPRARRPPSGRTSTPDDPPRRGRSPPSPARGHVRVRRRSPHPQRRRA